ncbi:MAG: pilus assembly protein TadG-related protein, partial [Acidobacteriota bacterium]|nr:pilus assembly protein TadG-related protein [Acidobacteriota bacterium]
MVATVLIPIVGLAIDGTILFFVKTKLSAAVDAAALAGARSLSTGLDLPSQTAAAQATIQSFFNANYPAGFWGSTNATLATSITQTAYKTRTVDIQAHVDSPLYFMRILGQNTSRIAAHGQTTRRDVNVIMVVDR